jgi:hypothetical protein
MHSDDEFAQKTERLQVMANSDQIFFFLFNLKVSRILDPIFLEHIACYGEFNGDGGSWSSSFIPRSRHTK